MKDLMLSRQLFVYAAELNSLSNAAKRLGITTQKAKELIFGLQRDVGEFLIEPNQKPLVLTKKGWKCFRAWQEAVHGLEMLGRSFSKTKDDVFGFVKIGFPTSTGTTLLTKLLAGFSKDHPNLRFDVQLTNGPFHPMWNGFDLRIVHEEYLLEDVEEIPLGKIRRIVVASPDYLRTHAAIRHPLDLIGHEIMGPRAATEAGALLLSKDSEQISIDYQPKISIRNHLACMTYALNHFGVAAMVPRYLAKPFIQSGVLKEVLADWKLPSLTLRAIMLTKNVRQPSVDLIVKYFKDYLNKYEEPA